MKFDLEKNEDQSAVLSLTVSKEDYKPKVDKVIKDYRKTATIPGFRKGTVPEGLVRKQYGMSITVDEVNKLIQEGVDGYLKEQEINILGQPLPVENSSLDWENDEHIFQFEIGIAPPFDLNIEGSTHSLDLFEIEVTKEMVAEEVEYYRRRYGKVAPVEKVGEEDYVKGSISHSLVDDDHKHSGGFRMDSIGDIGLRSKFLNAANGAVIEISLEKDFNSIEQAAELLNMDSAHLVEQGDQLYFAIESIMNVTMAEMNAEELFVKIFPEVTEESEFLEKVETQVVEFYKEQASYVFENLLVKHIVETVEMKLPKSFLKKWLQTVSENPTSDEELETQYPDLEKQYKWQLIEDHVLKNSEIQIGDEDMLAEAIRKVKESLSGYGAAGFEESMYVEFAKKTLQDEKEVRDIYQRVVQKKAINWLKERYGKNLIPISAEDFRTKHQS